MPFAHEPADYTEIDWPVATSLSKGAIATRPTRMHRYPKGRRSRRRPRSSALEFRRRSRCRGPAASWEGDGVIDGAILYGLEFVPSFAADLSNAAGCAGSDHRGGLEGRRTGARVNWT
jgi:hypothetical protein